MEVNNKEIHALVSLLGDSDEQIVVTISNKIKEIGIDTIPYLEKGLIDFTDSDHKGRIRKLLRSLKISKLNTDISDWKQNEESDLLKGLLIVAEYSNEEVNQRNVLTTLDNIEKEIELQINQDRDADIVQIFNDVILSKFKFRANTPENKGVNASYINKVLEKKSGYPIMLCAIYLIMARRFNVPLIGINSPRHFILAYVGNNIDVTAALPDVLMENITYFLDPFLQGNIYTGKEFNTQLKNAQFDMIYFSSLAANNVDIVRRVMNNVIYSIYHEGNENTAKRLLKIVEEL